MTKYMAAIYFADNGKQTQERDVFNAIAKRFGGWTLFDTTGGYIMSNKSLVVEHTYKLEIMLPDTVTQNEFDLLRQDIYVFAEQLKFLYEQESVFVTFQELHSAEFV